MGNGLGPQKKVENKTTGSLTFLKSNEPETDLMLATVQQNMNVKFCLNG
jgi:hypothetical protein